LAHSKTKKENPKISQIVNDAVPALIAMLKAYSAIESHFQLTYKQKYIIINIIENCQKIHHNQFNK
jgi:hypothetical protein